MEIFAIGYYFIIILRCDKNVNTSNSLCEGGTLIAVHSKFRRVLVLSPIISVEQVFICRLVLIYLCMSTIPSPWFMFWESYQFNSGIVSGVFNFANISWTNEVSSLEYNGSVTDRVHQIGDQYGTLHFKQIKYNVSNKSNLVLDFVFSNSKSIKVEKWPEALVPCDVYHSAIVITCTCLSDIPVLNEQHSY